MSPPPRNNAKKDEDMIEMDDINKNNDTSIRSSIRMVAEHHEEQIIHDAAAHDEVNGGKNESPNTTPILMTTTMDDAFHWQKYSDWATTAKEEGDDDDDDDDDTIENPASYASSTAGHTAVVQSFMSGGGATHAKLVAEIQKRRKIQRQRSNNPGLGIVPHQEVSFEIVDTPIWHHYRNHGRRSSRSSRSRNVDGGLRKRRKNKEQQQKETNGNGDDDVDDDDVGDAKVASTVAAASEPQPPSVAASPSPHRQQQPAADTTNERTRRIRIKEKQWERRVRNIVRYMIVIAIGIAMSVVGFVISYSADHLNNVKLDFALRAATSQHDDDDDDDDTNVHDARVGFGIFVSINIILALVAFVPVVLRPHSAGSGIAEAKAVLNGLVLDKCTDLMTAACKGLSVVFAASASLPIGLEGPLIFIGLSVGEHACRLCLPTTTTGGRRFSSLRTDRARRDFCAVGTASGVSAAFYAPIGGVLFALEEGASFWSQALMWQCFAAASVTLFVSYFWVACETRDFGTPIDFSNIAKFSGLDKHQNVSYPFVFYLRDFFGFVVLGIIGGCAGALFNWLNKNLTVWRRAHITSIPAKGLQVALLTSVMSILQWWLPIVYKQCDKTTDLPEMDIDQAFVYRQHNCNPGEYNHLSTLFLNNLSTVINILFHAPPTAFTATSCVIAGTVYYVMLILLFGSSIGMGIFIPLLYIGGAFGRAIGLVLTENWYPEGTTSSLVHTYSVVMATGMLGGVTQVLISISVIMMQATALSYFVVPFMIVTIFARVVARAFGARGIYDQILHLKGLPFLEEMPPEFIVNNSSLRARDIMSQADVSLHPEMKISTLIDILRGVGGANYEYQVTSPLHDEALIGTIRKSHILYLLQNKQIFYTLNESDAHSTTHNNRRPGKALKYDVLLKDDPHVPSLDRIEQDLNHDDLNKYVDLSPYLQIAPHTVDGHCSAERAYESFRMIGLRSLLVLGPNYKPMGVIKRSDLFILEDCSIEEDKGTSLHDSVAQFGVVS